MFSSKFISIGMMAAVVLILIMGLAGGHPAMPLVLIAFPLCALFIQRPDFWLAALVAICWSRLTIPGAPENLNAFHILSAALVVFLVPYRMMTPAGHRRSPVRKYVLGFAILLATVGAYRGFGLRVLRSDLWGGSPYAILIIACLLLLSSDVLVLRTRLWRNALIAMCLLTFLPVAAQSLYVFSGGRIYAQYLFVQPKGFIQSSLMAISSDDGIARFTTDLGVTLFYLPLLLFTRPLRGRCGFVTFLCLAAALVVSGFSGSRYSIVLVLTFFFFWSLLDEHATRWVRSIALLLGVSLALAAAAPFADHFPQSIQRTMSFIPWANVSRMASENAESTTIWRFDVWSRALHEDLPRYWIAGRGFAFDPREYEAIQRLGLEVRDWAFVTGSYHNGLLSLAINLGVGGLVLGLGFFWSTFREHLRILRSGFEDPALARMHRLVLAMFVNQTTLFLTLGGDVQNYFPTFLFQALVLEGLAKTKEATEAAVDVAPPTAFPARWRARDESPSPAPVALPAAELPLPSGPES